MEKIKNELRRWSFKAKVGIVLFITCLFWFGPILWTEKYAEMKEFRYLKSALHLDPHSNSSMLPIAEKPIATTESFETPAEEFKIVMTTSEVVEIFTEKKTTTTTSPHAIKQEGVWLNTAVKGQTTKRNKIDVTAAFADDAELKSVDKFTIDPLVPFFPKEIYRTNPDGTRYENWLAMDFPPRGTTWDKNYKTPCFTNTTSGKFRCVPKVYVVGWSKAGTTELWWYMSRHHELAHTEKKEPQFLTFRNFKEDHKQMFTFDELMKEWFDYTSKKEIKRNPNKILFEASATTIFFNWHWKIKQGYKGDPNVPTHTNFHYLRKIYPGTQIVALIRNPTTSALSFFNHAIKMSINDKLELPKFPVLPKNAMDIHNFFVESIYNFNECVKKTSLRACCHLSGYESQLFGHAKYFVFLRIGIYYIYLEEVYKNFPPSQVHLIKSEEFYEDEKSTLKDLFEFLGVSTSQVKTLIAKKEGEVSNDRPRYVEPAVETYQMLSEFYKPFNKRLAKMLGEEGWLKWEAESEQLIAKMKSK